MPGFPTDGHIYISHETISITLFTSNVFSYEQCMLFHKHNIVQDPPAPTPVALCYHFAKKHK